MKAEIIMSSNHPLRFDAKKCIGCNRCLEACQVDVMVPSEKGKHPIVMFPGECWYCGACVMECPKQGAIRLVHPIMNQTRFTNIK